jgi:S-adenosylmethionine:tRNA ribosyltransferase-isomerase
VRLLVARPDGIAHARFTHLPDVMHPGDLLVVNTSAMRPAAVDATLDGDAVVVHLSTALADGGWVVEVRRTDGTGPAPDCAAGDLLLLAGGGRLELARPAHPDSGRLWRARVTVPGGDVAAFMVVHGRPIVYGHPPHRWPLADYQTVFARRAGSAEMPSAGRPFTPRLITDLVGRGVIVAPVTLHAGVSSAEAHEPPGAEWFDVPEATAALVEHTRHLGRRVVAVGTTVTRALESAATADGRVRAARGWTDLVLGPRRSARVVGGLITGWHEAAASHMLLLEAVAGADLVGRAYEAALAGPYLWHEFGDSCLLLP